jgi:hypothetical protein
MGTMDLITIKNFANAADEKKEVKPNILQHVTGSNPAGIAHKDNIGILSNLKQAWREAESMVARQLKRSSEGIAEEVMDEPLPEQVQEDLVNAFTAYYRFDIVLKRMGCDSLLGRIKREFDKGQITIFPLSRVRSLAHVSKDTGGGKKERVGNVVMQFLESGDMIAPMDQEKIFSLFQQLDILAMTWAVAGSHDVAFNGGTAKFIHWQDAVEYVENIKERAIVYLTTSHDEESVCQIVTQVEALFRGKAIEDMRTKRSTCFGDALRAASKSEHHVWKEVSDALKPQASYYEPRQRPQKPAPVIGKFARNNANGGGKVGGKGNGKGKKSGAAKGGGKGKFQLVRMTGDATICAAFNNRNGCQKKCPNKQLHGCDVMLQSGKACGLAHPRHLHNDQKHGQGMRL